MANSESCDAKGPRKCSVRVSPCKAWRRGDQKEARTMQIMHLMTHSA